MSEVFKMPSVWSEQLGLPDVGPIWKDYPITEAEFLARQVKYGAKPVDMSKVTLGPRYGSEDMYRDSPDLRPGDRVAYEKDGIIYTDQVQSVRYSSPAPEIWPHRSVWQRMVRRLTPKRFRKPLQPIRPYKPATVTIGTDENPLERAQAQLAKTLAWIEGMKP